MGRSLLIESPMKSSKLLGHRQTLTMVGHCLEIIVHIQFSDKMIMFNNKLFYYEFIRKIIFLYLKLQNSGLKLVGSLKSDY